MLWICRRSSVEAIVYVHSLLFYLTDPSDILTRLRYPFSNKKSQCAKIAFSGFFVCVAFIFQSIFVIFCFLTIASTEERRQIHNIIGPQNFRGRIKMHRNG
jgi:hypothetical protein